MDWHTKRDPFTMNLAARISHTTNGLVGAIEVVTVNEEQPQAATVGTVLVFPEPDIPMPWMTRHTITTTPAKADEDLLALKPLVMEQFHVVHPGAEVSWPEWPRAHPILYR